MTRTSRIGRPAAIVVVGAMSVAGLAGCSTATDAKGSAEDPIRISYLHRLPDGAGMTSVDEIVERWNAQNPGIQVTATKFDGASQDMILKLETDVKAGKAPCLAQLSYPEIPQMYVKGLVEDVSAEAAKYADQFSAGAYGAMKVGDAVVGLPQDTGPLVYFYNEAVFDELGLAVPTTLDELTAVSAAASAAGRFATAFTADEATYWLSGQSAAAGDTWFSTDGDEWAVHATGEGSQRVASFWQNLVDNGQTLTTERWGDAFTAALTDGRLIGHVGAAWEAGFLLDPLDGTAAEGQWRVAQLPDYGAGAMTGPDGGSGVAVMKGCEHPAEAMKFNAWFNTQVDDLASQGLVVAAKGTARTSDKMTRQFGGQDVLGVLAEASQRLNPKFTYAPGFASLRKMNEVAAGVGSGSATVADVFQSAQDQATSALEDLGLPVAK